jgi:hypothetical protein
MKHEDNWTSVKGKMCESHWADETGSESQVDLARGSVIVNRKDQRRLDKRRACAVCLQAAE